MENVFLDMATRQHLSGIFYERKRIKRHAWDRVGVWAVPGPGPGSGPGPGPGPEPGPGPDPGPGPGPGLGPGRAQAPGPGPGLGWTLDSMGPHT